MNTKLTVRVEKDLVQAAKRYAAQQGVSLSQLIENYLRVLSIVEEEPITTTPILRRLSGILPQDFSIEDYHRHLEDKYG